jgi:hypothetical protein
MNDQFSISKSLMVFLTCLMMSLGTVAMAGTSVCEVDAQIPSQSESGNDAKETDDYDDDEEDDEEPECD